jgi:hypothetical protein
MIGPAAATGAELSMRVVGSRVEPVPVLHWPTEEEIRFTRAASRRTLLYCQHGVARYRNHAEADADMRRLIADAMARQTATLLARPSRC